jgi:hypothetical protein
MLYKEIITVYCDNHVKYINKLYAQNAEFLNIMAGSCHCA